MKSLHTEVKCRTKILLSTGDKTDILTHRSTGQNVGRHSMSVQPPSLSDSASRSVLRPRRLRCHLAEFHRHPSIVFETHCLLAIIAD